MSVKEIAKETIDNLPHDSSMDDIIHALYLKAKFDNGLKEIKSGKGVSHEEATKRLEKWVK